MPTQERPLYLRVILDSRMALPREERTSPGREDPKMRRATRSATTSSDPPIPPKPTAAPPPRCLFRGVPRWAARGFLAVCLVASSLPWRSPGTSEAGPLDVPAGCLGRSSEHREAWAGPVWPPLAGALPDVEAEVLHALRRAGLSGRVVRIAADTNGSMTVAALTVTHPAQSSLYELQTYVGRLLRAIFQRVYALDEVDLTAVARHQLDPGGLPDVTFTAAASRFEVLRAPGNLPPADLVRGLPRVWVHPLFDKPAERLQDSLLTQLPVPDCSADPLRTVLDYLQDLPDRLRGQLRGEVVAGKLYRGSPRRRAVALTFDDGPTPLYTPLLLDTLNRLRLHATFFLVGRRVEQYPYFAAALVQAGHELGNHSYAHRSLVGLPPDRVREDLQRAQRALLRATGRMPKLFRPPGGRYNRTVVAVASDLGMLTVLWTDDPGDYKGLGLQRLQTRLLSRVYSGGILLLHQGVPDTVRVLPAVWQVLRRHGYTVTRVRDLLPVPEGAWEPPGSPRR